MNAPDRAGSPVDADALRERVIDVLRTVFDPDIPVNIYELGLVYDVQVSAEGDVSYAGDTTSMQLTMQSPEMGQGVIEVRMVDNVMYMSMPPMTPEGKFLRLDLNDPNSPLGSLGGVTQGDPLETFKAFDEGLRDVKYLGSEDVDGEEMDHYVLTVDGKAAAKAQGAPAGSVPKELTYDLWLDENDLMRRVQYTMAGGGVTISMSDWGEPVTVKAPAKADIMEMPGS